MRLRTASVLIVLAILTRFWALGDRGMSHDESLHTFYSWSLYKGGGFSHTPLMHGPFLFHINALIYSLLGANDFTSRISVAIFARRHSVYLIAAAGSSSIEPKFPCPSTSG